jgi:hypothetical protein
VGSGGAGANLNTGGGSAAGGSGGTTLDAADEAALFLAGTAGAGLGSFLPNPKNPRPVFAAGAGLGGGAGAAAGFDAAGGGPGSSPNEKENSLFHTPLERFASGSIFSLWTASVSATKPPARNAHLFPQRLGRLPCDGNNRAFLHRELLLARQENAVILNR